MAELAKPIERNDQPILLSVSVGVAVADRFVSGEELLHEADSVMNAAEAAGRGRYGMFKSVGNDRNIDGSEIEYASGEPLHH